MSVSRARWSSMKCATISFRVANGTFPFAIFPWKVRRSRPGGDRAAGHHRSKACGKCVARARRKVSPDGEQHSGDFLDGRHRHAAGDLCESCIRAYYWPHHRQPAGCTSFLSRDHSSRRPPACTESPARCNHVGVLGRGIPHRPSRRHASVGSRRKAFRFATQKARSIDWLASLRTRLSESWREMRSTTARTATATWLNTVKTWYARTIWRGICSR